MLLGLTERVNDCKFYYRHTMLTVVVIFVAFPFYIEMNCLNMESNVRDTDRGKERESTLYPQLSSNNQTIEYVSQHKWDRANN